MTTDALRPGRRSFMLASLSTAALLASPRTSHAASALPVIRWGMFRNYQPVFVGISQGFFEQAGVRVELTGNFSSGPAIVQAAGMGQLDAGHSAITGLANAAAQGFKVTGVADSQTEFADAPLQQWFVLDKSPIRSVSDLRGKRIGTNSLSGSFYYTVLQALRRHGIGRNEVHFVVLPHERQEQALRAGMIDVAGIIDPYTVAAARSGAVRRLFTGADVLGQRQFSLVFFATRFIDEHPEAVRRFLVGYRKAVDFLRDNVEQGNRAMALALGLDPSLVVPHRYTDHARVIMPDVQFWLDTMRAGGELANAPALTANAIATERFHT